MKFKFNSVSALLIFLLLFFMYSCAGTNYIVQTADTETKKEAETSDASMEDSVSVTETESVAATEELAESETTSSTSEESSNLETESPTVKEEAKAETEATTTEKSPNTEPKQADEMSKNEPVEIGKEAMALHYFTPGNIARYNSYKTNNPDFTDEEVVTYVNIGLDNDFYSIHNIIDDPDNYLVLCNKYNKLPDSFVPEGYGSKDSKVLSLRGDAQKSYELMKAGAAKDGHTLNIISAYRSYNYQNTLYNNYKASDPAGADTYSARPGFSEHQTGLAVDLNATVLTDAFDQTAVFEWLYANAHEYGFILRYPKNKTWITGYIYEPWHWRYVGVEVAKVIKEQDITFEEYYVKYLDPQNLPAE